MKSLAEYPAESWRPNQRNYAEKVLELASSSEPTRCALEGPCGSGKSIGYLRGLLSPGAPKSMVWTTTRQHLRQLEETLRKHWPDSEGEEWAILRGRSYYGCCGAPAAKGWRKPGANPITEEDHDPSEEWAEDEEQEQQRGRCPRGDQCEYRRAVREAGNAQVNFQATTGGLYRQLYWSELSAEPDPLAHDVGKARERAAWNAARRAVVDRNVVVLDEAHEYLRVRRDFETQKVDLWLKGILDEAVIAHLQKARRKAGGYVASYVLLEPESHDRLMLAANIKRLMDPARVEKMLPAGRHLDNRDEIKRRWLEKLQTRLDMLERGDVVSVQWEGYGMQEKCKLVSEPLFAHVGTKIAPVEIFTSATIAEIAPLLKVPRENVVVYPEIFDWEGAVQVNPLPDNADGSKRSAALDAKTLEEIYEAPDRPMTIVLFLSKKQAHEAARNIARKPGVYLQGADPGEDLGELVERVKCVVTLGCGVFDRDDPGVMPMLITYGGWVGTDLPGNKWLVIGSAPKTPLGPVNEARALRGFIYNAWADSEKIMLDWLQLQQGLGRALRSATDQAVLIWPANAAFADLGLDENTGRLS